MDDRAAPVLVPAGEGPGLWVIDEHVVLKATAEQTRGAYALTESVVAPGGGPPPHVHHREDEAFWVLDGELEVTIGVEHVVAGAGAFVHLPRGVPHTFRSSGDRPARFLTLLVPGGLERFFAEVGTPGGPDDPPPPPTEEDLDRLVAVAATHGVEVLP